MCLIRDFDLMQGILISVSTVATGTLVADAEEVPCYIDIISFHIYVGT